MAFYMAFYCLAFYCLALGPHHHRIAPATHTWRPSESTPDESANKSSPAVPRQHCRATGAELSALQPGAGRTARMGPCGGRGKGRRAGGLRVEAPSIAIARRDSCCPTLARPHPQALLRVQGMAALHKRHCARRPLCAVVQAFLQ